MGGLSDRFKAVVQPIQKAVQDVTDVASQVDPVTRYANRENQRRNNKPKPKTTPKSQGPIIGTPRTVEPNNTMSTAERVAIQRAKWREQQKAIAIEERRKKWLYDQQQLDAIRGKLQHQSTYGYTPEERASITEKYLPGIQGQQDSQLRAMAQNQALSGVRGGVAFAQGDAIRKQALQARGGVINSIAANDFQLRRAAQGRLEDFLTSERAGMTAEELGYKQIEASQKIEADKVAALEKIRAEAAGAPIQTAPEQEQAWADKWKDHAGQRWQNAKDDVTPKRVWEGLQRGNIPIGPVEDQFLESYQDTINGRKPW